MHFYGFIILFSLIFYFRFFVFWRIIEITDYTYWMPFVEAKKFKSVNAYFSVCFQDYNDLKNEK